MRCARPQIQVAYSAATGDLSIPLLRRSCRCGFRSGRKQNRREFSEIAPIRSGLGFDPGSLLSQASKSLSHRMKRTHLIKSAQLQNIKSEVARHLITFNARRVMRQYIQAVATGAVPTCFRDRASPRNRVPSQRQGWRCGSGERKPAWPGPLESARKQPVMRLKGDLQLVRLCDDATRRSMQHPRDALCGVIATRHSLEIVDVQVRPTASHDPSR